MGCCRLKQRLKSIAGRIEMYIFRCAYLPINRVLTHNLRLIQLKLNSSSICRLIRCPLQWHSSLVGFIIPSVDINLFIRIHLHCFPSWLFSKLLLQLQFQVQFEHSNWFWIDYSVNDYFNCNFKYNSSIQIDFELIIQ